MTPLPGDPPRRVFRDADLELIVWTDAADFGFQLAYDLQGSPRVVEFRDGRLYHHHLDRGPHDHTQFDRTAFLTPAGALDRAALWQMFEAASDELPTDIRIAVANELGGETS